MILPSAWQVNECWNMDFVTDCLANGQCFDSLTIVDDRSCVSVAIGADFSLVDESVAGVSDRLIVTRGLPAVITVDKGPEVAGQTLDARAYQKNQALHHPS